jgi:hypothetical protein
MRITLKAALSLILCLPVLSQEHVDRQMAPRSERPFPKMDRVIVADGTEFDRLKAGESIPTLNGKVTVDELGIRIPPPPPSPRYAFNHFNDLKTECPKSLAYLNKELTQLFKDQAADIARMRSQPELASAGQESPEFQKLLVLSKAKTLNESEAAFISASQRLREELAASRPGTAAYSKTMMKLAIGGPVYGSDGVGMDILLHGQIIDEAQHTGYQMRAFDDQHFLDQYGPVFSSYLKAVDDYVKQVVTELETPESKLPLSALVVARLCKIRILTTYQIMTKANYQIWASSAGTGSREPNTAPTSSDASASGISWVQSMEPGFSAP